MKPALADAESLAMVLARRAATGDREATAELLRALAPRIAKVVRAVLGAHHPEIDDALQLSLIGFVQALPAFRGECDPAGYATTIAVRTALAARRRARTQQTRHEATDDHLELPNREPSPGEEAEASARKEAMRALLADLVPEQGEALAMRVVLGWSIAEIARHAGVPINTVRSRLRLAKEALKKRIERNPSLLELLELG